MLIWGMMRVTGAIRINGRAVMMTVGACFGNLRAMLTNAICRDIQKIHPVF